MKNNRRDFIKKSSVAAAGFGVLPNLSQVSLGDIASSHSLNSESMIVIQMAAHSMFDEGIAPVMDFLVCEHLERLYDN